MADAGTLLLGLSNDALLMVISAMGSDYGTVARMALAMGMGSRRRHTMSQASAEGTVEMPLVEVAARNMLRIRDERFGRATGAMAASLAYDRETPMPELWLLRDLWRGIGPGDLSMEAAACLATALEHVIGQEPVCPTHDRTGAPLVQDAPLDPLLVTPIGPSRRLQRNRYLVIVENMRDVVEIEWAGVRVVSRLLYPWTVVVPDDGWEQEVGFIQPWNHDAYTVGEGSYLFESYTEHLEVLHDKAVAMACIVAAYHQKTFPIWEEEDADEMCATLVGNLPDGVVGAAVTYLVGLMFVWRGTTDRVSVDWAIVLLKAIRLLTVEEQLRLHLADVHAIWSMLPAAAYQTMDDAIRITGAAVHLYGVADVPAPLRKKLFHVWVRYMTNPREAMEWSGGELLSFRDLLAVVLKIPVHGGYQDGFDEQRPFVPLMRSLWDDTPNQSIYRLAASTARAMTGKAYSTFVGCALRDNFAQEFEHGRVVVEGHEIRLAFLAEAEAEDLPDGLPWPADSAPGWPAPDSESDDSEDGGGGAAGGGGGAARGPRTKTPMIL